MDPEIADPGEIEMNEIPQMTIQNNMRRQMILLVMMMMPTHIPQTQLKMKLVLQYLKVVKNLG